MRFSNRYPLKPFQQTDFAKIKQVISRYPLATLISQGEAYPTVSQVPLILDEEEANLLGHFDRNNPHCETILQGGNIYCVFNGPNAYITPTIYPDAQYPGWNYVAVHVQGRVKAIMDEQRLAAILLKTARLNEPEQSGYDLLPSQANFSVYLKMIRGFEIELVDVRGVFKLAQDKGHDHAELARRYVSEVGQRDVGDFLKGLLE